jgi:phage shock protein B
MAGLAEVGCQEIKPQRNRCGSGYTMEAVSIVGFLFVAPILALAIVCGAVLLAIKMIKGGGSQRGQQQEAEEARTIQEIYQGLSRIEERVEALETILLDRAKGDREK